jgi:hypothetical protein
VSDVRYQVAIDRRLDADLTEDAAEIEVQQSIEGPTTFRVRFAVDVCDGDLEPLNDPRLNPGDPDTEVTLLAYVDGEAFVLSHGVITQRQAKLERGGAGSYVDVQGSDRRVVMERVVRREAHAGHASDAVDLIFRRYGFEPDIAETEIEYGEAGNTLNQTEDDLSFVTALAGRNGMRFWIDWSAETGLAGFDVVETAHFRPSPPRPATNALGFAPPLLLAPQAEAVLRLNTADPCATAATFEVASTAEAPNRTGPIQRVEPGSGGVEDTEVPGPSDEPLGEEPSAPGQERSQTLVTPGGVQEARVRNEAALNDAAWTVNATAETSARLLGTVVMPHRIVRVEGTGRLTDGDWFVKAVTHTIGAADHKMRIELLRNALGAAR